MRFSGPRVNSPEKGETYNIKNGCFYSWLVYDPLMLGGLGQAL